MQAVWGQEKGAPTPVRGAELYGEVGRWKVSTAESIPGIYTGAEDPNKRWASPSKRRVPVTSQSTKRPPEMDVAPVGVKVAIGSKPDVMHMANHDHGVVWPPTAPRDMAQVPFRAMQKEKPDHAPSVNGVMVGYTGHVPRSRDKVGGCPLGGVPGRPGVRSAAPPNSSHEHETKVNTINHGPPSKQRLLRPPESTIAASSIDGRSNRVTLHCRQGCGHICCSNPIGAVDVNGVKGFKVNRSATSRLRAQVDHGDAEEMDQAYREQHQAAKRAVCWIWNPEA